MTDLAVLGIEARPVGFDVANTQMERLQRTSRTTQTATERFQKANDNAARSMQEFGRHAAMLPGPLGNVAGRMSAIGSGATAMAIGIAATTAALVAAAAVATRSVAAFQAFETQQLTLNGVLRATGGAAGQTAADIEGMAQSIASATLASTTGVRQAAGQLLTFRSIAGETFERTLTLAQDLAAVGFGSISSASVQLGKALEDPIRGVSALAEVGVSFSASQREVIKSLVETGRAAEAQRLILDAVEQQVGGAGSAAAGGLAGAYDSLGQAVDNHLVLVGEQVAKYTLLREGILGIANAINEANENMRPATTAERLSGVNTRIGEAQGRLSTAQEVTPFRPANSPIRDQAIRADEEIINQLYEERASLLRTLQQEFLASERANIAATEAAAQAATERIESVKASISDQIEFNRLTSEQQAIQKAVREAGVELASAEGQAIAGLVTTLISEDEARKAALTAAKAQQQEREKAQRAIDSVVESLKFEIDQLGRTSQEQRLYNELKSAGVERNSAAGQEISRLVSQLAMEEKALRGVADAARDASAAMATTQPSAFGQMEGTRATISQSLNPVQTRAANAIYGEDGYDMQTRVGGISLGPAQGARMFVNSWARPNEAGFKSMDAVRMYQDGAVPPNVEALNEAAGTLRDVVGDFASTLRDNIRDTERTLSRLMTMQPPRPDPYAERNADVFYDVNADRHFLSEQQKQITVLESQLREMRMADDHLRELISVSRDNPSLFAAEIGKFLGNFSTNDPRMSTALSGLQGGLGSFNSEAGAYASGSANWEALARQFNRDPNDPELQSLVSKMIEDQLKLTPFMSMQMALGSTYRPMHDAMNRFSGMAGFADGGSFDVTGSPGVDRPHLVGLAGGERVHVVTPAQRRTEEQDNKPQAVDQRTQHIHVHMDSRDAGQNGRVDETGARNLARMVAKQMQRMG